ncbi:type I polyketide synthase [Cryptosporangium japonicum]|uniref:Acyl transferase domain-containing protein n=1 Tax=Cryptosporangium japonicum TaxID=80872 RepID=A0ABN0TKD2_9ACTN
MPTTPPRPAVTRAVAVVGVACRLPGAPDPDAFWSLLVEGRDAIGLPPADRHADSDSGWAGRRAGYLTDVDRFDPAFFGLSPREAAAIDPQQRLMLELGWEALEDSGAVPASIRGDAVGVFVGGMWDDHETTAYGRGGVPSPHTLTGTHRGMIANRLSYVLGLTGPSLVVDTGQSSGLSAVHLARTSLLAGESTTALVGAVNLNLLGPRLAGAEKIGALSPDATCYTFDARANGYVPGEGAVCLVLKPVARAIADSDRIYCLLTGSAMNNDGGGAGLTVPEQAAQEAVLRRAHADAGTEPARIQYVELHGTGTPVGDPVEAAALGAVFGPDRTEPLAVGSAKTNVGHLEGAAGLVGLLKTALSLHHRILPGSRNHVTPNPALRLAERGIRVVTGTEPWPDADCPLSAGVSAFGMGGTNCHVVAEEAPPVVAASVRPGESGVVPWIVTGRDESDLRAHARRLHDHLAARPALDPAEVGFSLATTRTAFDHRAVVVAEGRDEGLAALGRLAAGEPSGAVRTGRVSDRSRVAFLFPGQGSQWPGMAEGMRRTSTVFRTRFTEAIDALEASLECSLTGAVDGAVPLDRDDVVQPLLFATMVGLAAVWRSLGVRPAAVIGHSQGEIAAACVAGALSLEDAAQVVALRSRLLRELAGTGGMASVALPEAVVAARIAAGSDGLVVAAVNGPASTVVAGPVAAVDALIRDLSADGVRAGRVPIDYASHSPLMTPIREPLLAALRGIEPRSTEVAFYSTVTAGRLAPDRLGPDYWYRNVREPVRLADTVRGLLADGYGAVLEMSPHPLLVGAVTESAADRDVLVTGSLRRDDGGPARLLSSVASAFVAGVPVDWPAAFGAGARRVPLPTYPFRRSRLTGRIPQPSDTPLAPATRDPLEIVLSAVAAVLGYGAADEVPPDVTFKELGLDSATAVELGERLGAATGRRWTVGVIFGHPTPTALAAVLRGEQPPAPAAPVGDSDPLDAMNADELIRLALGGPGAEPIGGTATGSTEWR